MVRSTLPLPELGAGGPWCEARPTALEVIQLRRASASASSARSLRFRWPGRYGLSLYEMGGEWMFTTAAGAEFSVDQTGLAVGCRFAEGTWPGIASEAFVRRVLPRIVQLRGRTVLHAAALDTGAGVVLLCGDSGAGKSTLAASLNQQLGWDILSDDMAVLEDQSEAFQVHPAGNAVSLWADSQAVLAGGFEKVEPLAVYEAKFRCQPPPPTRSAGQTLRAVYHLTASEPDRGPAVRVTELSPMERLALLARQTIRFNPADRQAEARTFQDLGRLGRRMPIRSLHYPRNFAALSEVAGLLSARHPSPAASAAA